MFRIGDIIRSLVLDVNPNVPNHKIEALIDKYFAAVQGTRDYGHQ